MRNSADIDSAPLNYGLARARGFQTLWVLVGIGSVFVISALLFVAGGTVALMDRDTVMRDSPTGHGTLPDLTQIRVSPRHPAPAFPRAAER